MGIEQQYALGKWLRRRYRNLLSSEFNVSDVYVRSSDSDRTLMSAQANLAGLYAPKGRQVWNNFLLWRPVPVHSLPENIDYITGGSLPKCRSYEEAYKAYLASDEMKEFEQSIQPIYDYLTANIGIVVDAPILALLIRDSLLDESIHNLP